MNSLRFRNILFFVSSLLLAGVAFQSEARVKVGKMPKEAVARQQLKMLGGQQFSLAELRGKVVVLNFFAVWCGHSKDLIPTLIKASESDPRGVQVLGLASEDVETTRTRVEELMKQLKINYPVGMVSDALFTKFVESNDRAVPQTLIYARDGKLVAHLDGHDARIEAELMATVKRELRNSETRQNRGDNWPRVTFTGTNPRIDSGRAGCGAGKYVARHTRHPRRNNPQSAFSRR